MPNVPKHPKSPKKLSWKKVALATGAVAIVAGSITVAKRVIDPGEIVTSVFDGDTFTISNKQTIRLFDVDAPELQYCFGQEARDVLSKKILGKKVVLKSPRTDFYKRVEAYVYLDGEFINEYMARNGHGVDHSSGGEDSQQIRDAGNLAKVDKVGIYSERCYPLVSPNKTCNIKGHIPYDTTDKTYLYPGCWNYKQSIVERYRGEDWFCTEKEAKAAGFTLSPNCKSR